MTGVVLVPVLVTLIVAGAVVVQRVTGSGFGLIAAPLLLLVQPALVPGPVLLVTLAVMCSVVWHERRGLRHRDLMGAAAASVPGALCGMVVARSIDVADVQLVGGVVIVVAALLGAAGARLRQTRTTLVLGGAVGGLLGSLIAAPGPAMMLVYDVSDAARYRANLGLYYLVSCSAALVVLCVGGEAPGLHASALLPLLPGALLGAVLAGRVARALSAHALRPAVLLLCCTAGAGLVLRGLA